MSFLVDLAFFVFAASCGIGVAWLVFFRYRMTDADPVEESQAHFAHETLIKLQELTSKVAADVDRHSSTVREINAQLADSDDEAAVLAAVAQLIDANRRMQERLDNAEQRLQVQARQMESHAVEARTDALTQVANRRALDDEIRRCLADFTGRGVISTLMLIDVDHFKKFNDVHGHQSGDEVLRGVARVLRNNVSEVGLVARYGGEEFAVILPRTPLFPAVKLAEQLRHAVMKAELIRRSTGEKHTRLTISVGVAALHKGASPQAVIEAADICLHAAKRNGRNCVVSEADEKLFAAVTG